MTHSDVQIEAAARAAHEHVRTQRPAHRGIYNPSWDGLDEAYREYLRGIQRAALAAAEEAGIVKTVEEFEALPEDTLILSVRHDWGRVYRIARRSGGADYYTNEPEPDWNEGISDGGAVFDTDWLPATLIWLPVEGSEG